MSSCSFSSVCDAYDGGIVPSLNNPYASLTASNTSFIGCCRTRNVKCEGNADHKLTPGRQNTTENGANSFIWCEWNGSRTTGESDSYADGSSNGGAIYMYSKGDGTISVAHCSFNGCAAFYAGGGVMCANIKLVEIENNSFSACSSETWIGGGLCVFSISACVRISGCEFQNCKANNAGGGFRLDTIQVIGSGCVPTENSGGESARVFDCSFISCSLTNNWGGGMSCVTVPSQLKMRSIQFISCSAMRYGGGLYFHPNGATAPNDKIYCYYLFFHECKCRTTSTPYGHDAYFVDAYNLYLSSINPFYECYTTNTDDKRMCYAYNPSGTWIYDQTSKRDWLKDKTIYVSVGGDDNIELCGMNESNPCLTVKKAFEMCEVQISLSITLMEGNHQNETSTIDIGAQKISVIGTGKDKSSIGTKCLSSTGVLFSVTTGHLSLFHMKVDCNSTAESSPSVVVVSDGSGSLSLEDVVITTSVSSGNYVMSSSVFVVALSQLSMVDVEIINMNVSKSLFSEPVLSSSSSSSSGLFMTTTASGDSVLANVTVQNVRLTRGDGVVVAKSVKAGETFVVQNVTIEGCECVNGSSGGIKIDLSSPTSKARIGASSTTSEATKFNRCNCSGFGGGVMMSLADNSNDFSITTVSFDDCAATLGGKNLFVEAQDLSDAINSASFGFNPEIGINVADLNELCGRERNNPELVVPLVVFLRTFPSPAYVSGRGNGSEFRLCGYEDYPCRGIGNVGEVQFPSSKRMIRLTSTFSFDEEVQLDEQSYEIDSSNKDVGLKIGGTGTKTQEALVMNSVSSTLTGILFELGGSIGERSSFIYSSSGTLRFADCGIKMGNGVDSANYVFVSGSGGKVEIIRMSCGGSVGKVRFGGCMIVVNGSCEWMMDEVISSQIDTDGVNGLIEIATSSSVTIQNCSITNCDLPNCGVIHVEKCSSITLKNTSFENITRGAGDGGCLWMSPNDDRTNTIRVENCTFLICEVNGNGKRGGGLSVSLENPSELRVSSTRFEKCCAPSTSGSEGKGGGIFLSLAYAEAKFNLSRNLIFDQNKAEYGKNMFISTTDLNESVTSDSFNFDYSSMISDKTLFMGSDNFHSNKDLFMFLIPFSSSEIFISSGGFDVARCGSEEEPCFTMWKGMENMNDGEGKKTIQIEGSTFIRDSFNASNYLIKKGVKMGEEDTKATLNFEKAVGSQLEYFMENDGHLELTNIRLQLASGFDNSAKTIISNKNGELAITGCSFHSEAGMNNGFDCVFVDVIGGSVEVNDLSMESCNVGNNIFVIHDAGVSCHFVNVRVDSLNESKGCIFSIKKSDPGLKINEGSKGGINLQIDKSSFSGVKRSYNGPSILQSMSEKKICLVVNASNITEGKAETSEKGGAIFFTLGASGSMKMIDSTTSQSSCTNGKGGGVYLATKERGELNFSFVGMKFSSNTARVGNDIFIECFNITSQINESQFQFDLRENHYSRINAIYGFDSCEHKEDTNLIDFVTIHQSDTIVVSSVNGSNDRQCGTNTHPCASIEHGLIHLTSELISQILVVEESVIGREINLKEMSLSSKSRENCKIEVKSSIEKTKDALVTTTGTVSLVRVKFVFDSNFISSHESLISPEGGILEMMNCSFDSKQSDEDGNIEFAIIPFQLLSMEKGEFQLDGCAISNLVLHELALYLSSPLSSVIYLFEISNSTIKTSLIDINECGQLTIKDFKTENITVEGNEESLISCLSPKKTIQLTNCTMCGVSSKITKGKLIKVENCTDVKMDNCIFDGMTKERNEKNLNIEEEICRWEGSLVDIVKSSVFMKDIIFSNSAEGGITMSGGNFIIEAGNFSSNNPFVQKYPSLRRNIICSDSASLTISSLKGGDGVMPNSSLWILNDGCTLGGIAGERPSPFFIPKLEEASLIENGNNVSIKLKGALLLPCDLSFRLVYKTGDVELVETYQFEDDDFVSETEVLGTISSENISKIGEETEVSVMILFGKQLAATSPQILKNRSESKVNGDERIVEGVKERKSFWLLIVIIMAFVLLLILIIAVISTIRWRNAKNENKELREIVNDTVRKDPKLIEMTTMEMSPEEQWRRAEREAEKKNEERIKKRVYEKSLQHSESSEHLLSESGSTEYILGRDSEKIPEWMLEKVDEKEEEEIRKKTPSPSISSTSSTDTSDTESTFVRREDLCPTTSSMSNLVDAMACSSPHEKLIVDLRDSLFMLLHGRNKTKEMAIGTLQEREQTAAQILFWVANLALHSFDEMESPLQSLANLSPHIVLFSEHMVICIVMHSDLLSDDSDSSSISSSTIVTSFSDDDDDDDSLPSSAFEDEGIFKKECLRWKAPELLINKNMEASKESVSFSIGMMLWECLTLQIPFGDYEAEVAGQKIVNGERTDMAAVGGSSFCELIKLMVSEKQSARPTLSDLKREFIQKFPAGAVILTVSDAVTHQEGSREKSKEEQSESLDSSEIMFINS
ncbi:uncharacterized protein MONOS_3538 [Monocercomonoides exilis]|uniref:uncharacterized protein n=1 Tax=Monocercomonoides exilis TaxID=2049356 RepID=UPI003559C708|nr:hypothetical protein MONOS_3538 [Monocercomonoides exilis]|eukprot:MONOS_3538.1-p1 / transcript=MONOS_3538.1 / gene=MONOS_3538 / organism=Monocercomonoides_exilis_PA203 / gene_product=unspecified product / transcript_product=unspecified product / location=Mono_scaffold00084:13010-20353(+) / protein_length=2447 / sequence_SO=supercontig / SO=protein_coding / is_pseudo=false